MTIRNDLHRKRRATLALACSLGASLAGCTSPAELSIDTLARDQARYLDKPVVLASCVVSSRHEFALTSCTDATVYVAIRRGSANDPKWDALKTHALTSWNRDRMRRVTLEGVLERDAATGRNVFVVDSVAGIPQQTE